VTKVAWVGCWKAATAPSAAIPGSMAARQTRSRNAFGILQFCQIIPIQASLRTTAASARLAKIGPSRDKVGLPHHDSCNSLVSYIQPLRINWAAFVVYYCALLFRLTDRRPSLTVREVGEPGQAFIGRGTPLSRFLLAWLRQERRRFDRAFSLSAQPLVTSPISIAITVGYLPSV
jgi:hypothetical protein